MFYMENMTWETSGETQPGLGSKLHQGGIEKQKKLTGTTRSTQSKFGTRENIQAN